MLIKLLETISSPYDYCDIPPGEYEVKVSNFTDYEMKRKVMVASLSGMKISHQYYLQLKDEGVIVEVQKQPELLPEQPKEESKMESNVVAYDDGAMSVERLKRQVNLIQQVMRETMKENEHYGVIPGCQKPSLLKPGAEKLGMTFRLAPYYEDRERELSNGHKEVVMRCTLKHIESGLIYGEGVGSCTTLEAKYRYRKADQKCPECGETTIIKGKKEYGGGWLCYKKKGGCGAKFKDGDPAIENQEMGRIEHDNPADYYNTVLKMAKKRAHVDAILTATAASDIFTQDVEDLVENGVVTPKAAPQAEPQKKAEPRTPAPKPAQPKDMATPKQKKDLMAQAVSRFANQDNAMKFITWALENSGQEYWSQSLIEDVLNDFDNTAAMYVEATTAQEEDIPV